jgi:uncharacterized protein
MKQQALIIFFTVFFSLYFAANYYIFIRGWQALPDITMLKKIYLFSCIFLVFSFAIGRFSEHILPGKINHFFVWIGSFWLGAMAFFFFIVLLTDIIKLANIGLHFLPIQGTTEYAKIKTIFLVSTIGLVISFLVYGFFNAKNTQVKQIEIITGKNIPDNGDVKVAVVTDIHLGTLIGKNRLNKLTNLVNKQNPDIIILAGDILDEVQTPILTENIGEPLAHLKARYGVYAITGNHEYIGGINRSVKYIESLGITLLRDSITEIEGKIVLIGREDRDMKTFTGKQRKTKEELLNGIDTSKFLILVDHQPYELNKTVKLKLDLQISGHTHHGQIWPFNKITDAIYELSNGYIKRGATHFYVSPGYGTWGPPVRIGTYSEIAIITIKTSQRP